MTKIRDFRENNGHFGKLFTNELPINDDIWPFVDQISEKYADISSISRDFFRKSGN